MVWLLLLVLFIAMYQVLPQNRDKYPKIAYSPTFVDYVEGDKIRSCEIVVEVSGVQYVRGELTDIDSQTDKNKRFKTFIVEPGDVQKMLKEKGIEAEVSYQNPLVYSLLTGAIPFLLILGLLYFLFMRQLRAAGEEAGHDLEQPLRVLVVRWEEGRRVPLDPVATPRLVEEAEEGRDHAPVF